MTPPLLTKIGTFTHHAGILTVVFKNYTRRYEVPAEVFYPMYYSSNPGKYYNQHIKKQYDIIN